MLTKRDEMLGRLTSHLSALVTQGTFVGHDAGVSLVVQHERLADFTWDELDASDDPVELARERLASLAIC